MIRYQGGLINLCISIRNFILEREWRIRVLVSFENSQGFFRDFLEITHLNKHIFVRSVNRQTRCPVASVTCEQKEHFSKIINRVILMFYMFFKVIIVKIKFCCSFILDLPQFFKDTINPLQLFVGKRQCFIQNNQ